MKVKELIEILQIFVLGSPEYADKDIYMREDSNDMLAACMVDSVLENVINGTLTICSSNWDRNRNES